MDVKKIREQFPIFGTELVYLDSAATSQKPQSVIDAVSNFYAHEYASVHRGVYDLSERATERYESVRTGVARFINATDTSEIIFTSGTTGGINFVADTWGMEYVKEGDEILVTQAEHHANLLPWQRLARQVGATLRFIEIDTDSFLCAESAIDLITPKTKLVALIHSSNVLGNIWRYGQLDALIEKAHSVGARVLLDGAQSVPHQKIDVQRLNPDFFVFSGHKMLGPTGVGALYMKQELQEGVPPYQVGGSMVYEATFDHATWAKPPAKFEAGMPPIAQVIGLGASIDFYNSHIDFDALCKNESGLSMRTLEAIRRIDGITPLVNEKNIETCGHLVAFTVDGIHAHDVAAMLGMRDIAVRAGHHCAQPLAGVLGIDASVRASFCAYNTIDDVEKFVRELRDVVQTFKNF